MVLFINGDIGGTNTRLQLWRTAASSSDSTSSSQLVAEKTYKSDRSTTLLAILRTFLDTYNAGNRERVAALCIAIAGPVSDNSVLVTNLNWHVKGAELSSALNIPHVRIINDFEGNGYGLLLSQGADEVYRLPGSGAAPLKDRPIAVIGAGTGLGECYLTHNGRDYVVYPCEGGHADFAPRNQTEFELMEFIKDDLRTNHKITDPRVSVERVVSGLGLPMIYKFFAKKQGNANAKVEAQVNAGGDVGVIISTAARKGECPVAVASMDLFMQCYGAEAGNLSLKTLCYGGLYIAGGIAVRNTEILEKNNQFMQAMLAKGRLGKELERIPVYLLKSDKVGLLGAKAVCERMLRDSDKNTPIQKLKAKL